MLQEAWYSRMHRNAPLLEIMQSCIPQLGIQWGASHASALYPCSYIFLLSGVGSSLFVFHLYLPICSSPVTAFCTLVIKKLIIFKVTKMRCVPPLWAWRWLWCALQGVRQPGATGDTPRHHHTVGGQGHLCAPPGWRGHLRQAVHHHLHAFLHRLDPAAHGQARGDPARQDVCLQLPQWLLAGEWVRRIEQGKGRKGKGKDRERQYSQHKKLGMVGG